MMAAANMRRADRLFRIIQLLRRAKRPVTAETLAGELETSKRSVYRDIAELMAQQVPIRGEAGLGYVLDRQFDMPPLMLTPDELEAAVLGAQWVAMRGDPVLANAARDLLAKITHSVPERLRAFLRRSARPRRSPRRPMASTSRSFASGFAPDARSDFAISTSETRRPSAPSGRSSSGTPRRCVSSRGGASYARDFVTSAPTGSSLRSSSTGASTAARPIFAHAGSVT